MSKRSTSSATISFGLVSIPVKFYTSTSSNAVSFNQINPKTGNRVKQKLVDAETFEELKQDDLVKGLQYSKDKYVIFTKEELDSINSIEKNSVGITDFCLKDDINQFQIEKYYFISPDKGSARSYKLFAEALKATKKVAIGTWAVRSKEHLVAIIPHEDGLVVAQLWYSDEVRKFESDCPNISPSKEELELGIKLVNQQTKKDFDISKYFDKFSKNVNDLAEKKANGEEFVLNTEYAKSDITDLFAQLKASIEAPKVEEKPKKRSSRKKAS